MSSEPFHSFPCSVDHYPLPEKFTFPFHYTPHPRCLIAAEAVQAYLQAQTPWAEELKHGKMFGVLLVQNPQGELGFLAAFSGNLAGRNDHPYFVPPVFDLLQKDGFFKLEEEVISSLNTQIELLTKNDTYLQLEQNLRREQELATLSLLQKKEELKTKKEERDAHKKSNPICSSSELEQLNRESQHEKGEYKRLEKNWEVCIHLLQEELSPYRIEIERMKDDRKRRSAALQQRLFDAFRFLNAKGEEKGLRAIFEQTVQKTPPAGAGECAAPKLLHYAFLMGFKPLAMAEFWWGASPKREVRRHGQFYPACKGKCAPILDHVLQGMVVENDPFLVSEHLDLSLDIVFEDEFLVVVNKPSGLLSVAGKSSSDSLYHRIKVLYPFATGPLLVHRLDMATSGLLLIAKSKEVHKNLQAQFKNRTIKKRYVALLEGVLEEPSGSISLPLSADYNNRPCQMVDPEQGKPALTHWRVLERRDHQTRVEFTPVTGRTHQLRLHAAHVLGLNAAIVGDELYGKKGKRLCLHAEYLEFRHPVGGEILSVEKKGEF